VFRRGLVSEVEESDSPRMRLSLFRFWTWIHSPISQLSVYTAPLTSPSCSFITHLSIDDIPAFQADEFLALAKMANLGVLEIMDRGPGNGNTQVSDRLLRGWSETPGAFPALRVLRIHIRYGLTRHCIRYASQLPSLAVFEATMRDFSLPTHGRQALALGWRVEKSSSARTIVDTLRAMEYYPRAEDDRWDYDLSNEVHASFVPYDRSNDFQLDYQLHQVYANDEEIVSLPPRSTRRDRNWELLETKLSNVETEAAPMISYQPDFGSWAFWLYAAVGQQNSNEDLRRQIPSLGRKGRLHDIEVSPLPVVCVRLGSGPSVLQGAPAPNFLFIRSPKEDARKEPKPEPSTDAAKNIPRKKRRVMFNVVNPA